MKKTILTVLVLLTGLQQWSLAGNGIKNEYREVEVQPFDQLQISANITVILYESKDISTIVIKGKQKFTRRIAVLQKENQLLVTTRSGANLKEYITVFIPVNRLRSLSVSDDARVRSQTVLQTALLELSAEGLSEINLIVNGPVSVIKGGHHALVKPVRPGHVMPRLLMPLL